MRDLVVDHHVPASRQWDRTVILAVVLLSSVFPVNLFPGSPQDRRGADGQLSGKQGEVLVVEVPSVDQASEAVGQFLGRRILFFKRQPGYAALLGLDVQDPPGTHELTIELRSPRGLRRLSYNVLVMKQQYPLQHLTLPRDKVDLDEANVIRVKAEQEQVRSMLEAISRERFWQERFIEPVRGTVTGAFGSVRVINGQPRSPHNGEDIAAPLGTDVVAMNDGIARLTVDHFFSGKGVFVDHGLGLYSMYFHLDEITVHEGELVKRGQVIGRVGASGRTTGPHLHWGVRLNGARVNPISLTALPLNGVATTDR